MPMPVQKAAIPRLIAGENLVLSAGTGSGKTLAYMLPVIQRLLEEESQGYVRVVSDCAVRVWICLDAIYNQLI